MRVAIVVPGGVDRSGEVRVIPAIVALIGRLAVDNDVHVFATHQDAAPDSWILEGARVHNIGVPRTLWRAARAVQREHRARPFEVIHAFWAGRHGAIAVSAAKLLGVPSVVHVAGGELAALEDIGYGGCRTLRGRILQRAVLRSATAVTCASQPIAVQIAARGVKAERLPLGVDVRHWPVRAPVRRRPDEPVRLLHVASLNAVKDQATFLRALGQLADAGRKFEVDVVGEDTLGGRVQALAEDLGLASRIRFHGFLPQRALRPIVEAAHVAVISSRHEAGPVAMLEAALSGVPTVGTAVGHLAEWTPHAALAVPCRDPAALARAIATLLDDEELRLSVASAAARNAAREDAAHTARAFNELYRRLVTARAYA
jgi:glycosyltransferase involved in cell wall biosynthesis